MVRSFSLQGLTVAVRKVAPNMMLLSLHKIRPVLVVMIVKFYMNLRTVTPKTMPRKVAIAIPNMPARIPGTTKELHPLAVAIPQAVVGPPTLAFDAISNSFRSKRNSFPSPRITARWTAIWTRANMKILGAVLMTFPMFPLAPTTVKNTCHSKASCRDMESRTRASLFT